MSEKKKIDKICDNCDCFGEIEGQLMKGVCCFADAEVDRYATCALWSRKL